MDAVILAAGAGTRMGPLTDETPKPLLAVADKPLAAHVADVAVEAGASSIVFVVGPDAEKVRETFGSRYRGLPVEYAVQDPANGTAGAVRTALPQVEGQFAVLNGDNLYDADSIEDLFDNGPGIGVHEVADPSSYGVVETNGDRVVDIVEKPDSPPSNLVNAGAYVFPGDRPAYFDVDKSDRGEYELTDVISRFNEDGALAAVEIERWMDVGRPWELLEANEMMVSTHPGRIEGEVHDTAVVSPDAIVESGATILPGSVIEGAVYVRSGATIGPNARVRGTTLVGENASIGHAVEVKNTVMAPGSTVAHLSYVGDSIVGPDVNVGAGTNVANLRHDEQPVKLTVNGDRISTGRRKFGAVFGPRVKTGINTSIDPGVTLSADAATKPGEVVHRDR